MSCHRCFNSELLDEKTQAGNNEAIIVLCEILEWRRLRDTLPTDEARKAADDHGFWLTHDDPCKAMVSWSGFTSTDAIALEAVYGGLLDCQITTIVVPFCHTSESSVESDAEWMRDQVLEWPKAHRTDKTEIEVHVYARDRAGYSALETAFRAAQEPDEE